MVAVSSLNSRPSCTGWSSHRAASARDACPWLNTNTRPPWARTLATTRSSLRDTCSAVSPPGHLLPLGGQVELGARGVPAVPAPLGLAMADHPQLALGRLVRGHGEPLT